MATSPEVSRRTFQQFSPLGNGSNGTVYRGEDKFTASPVAVKQISRRSHAIYELHNLQSVQGVPHVLQLRGAEQSESSSPSIILDLIRVPDLFKQYKEGVRLSFDEVVSVMKQALEAFARMHELKILYADFKDDQLLWESRCRHLTIADFGNSGVLGVQKSEKIFQGAQFRSPEVVLKGPADEGVDLWSFGCVVYKLITGENLFPVRFWPDHVNTAVSDNQHLHMMVDLMGRPGNDFLNSCRKVTPYFRMNAIGGVEFVHPLTPSKTLPQYGEPQADTCYWQRSISPWDTAKKALETKGVEKESISQVLELLRSIFRYTGRPSAAQLLKLPLFETDLHFHLHLPEETEGNKSRDQISIYRSCEVLDDTFPQQPSSFIDRQDRVTRLCYHVKKDPENKYYFVVSRNQVVLLTQLVFIQPGDHIHLRELSGGMAITSERVDGRVSAIAKRTLPIVYKPVTTTAPVVRSVSNPKRSKSSSPYVETQPTSHADIEGAKATIT